jgi:hypothetical protein
VKTKKTIIFFLKFLVSFSLLGYILTKVEFDFILKMIPKINLKLLLVVFGLVGLERMIACYRWNVLLKAININISFFLLLRIFLITNSIGSLSPGGIGGDALKIYSIGSSAGNFPSVSGSILADRLIGFLSLLGISSVCSIFVFYEVPAIFFVLEIGIICLAFLAVILAFVFKRTLYKIIKKIQYKSYGEKLCEALANFRNLISHKIVFFKTVFISLLVNFLKVLYVYFFAISIDIRINFIYFLVFIPMIFFIKQLPLSINGIGLSQMLYIVFFEGQGVSPSEAFILSTGMMIIGYFFTIFGSIFYLTNGITLKKEKVGALN